MQRQHKEAPVDPEGIAEELFLFYHLKHAECFNPPLGSVLSKQFYSLLLATNVS